MFIQRIKQSNRTSPCLARELGAEQSQAAVFPSAYIHLGCTMCALPLYTLCLYNTAQNEPPGWLVQPWSGSSKPFSPAVASKAHSTLMWSLLSTRCHRTKCSGFARPWQWTSARSLPSLRKLYPVSELPPSRPRLQTVAHRNQTDGVSWAGGVWTEWKALVPHNRDSWPQLQPTVTT